MKKYVQLVMVAVFALSFALAGCGGGDGGSAIPGPSGSFNNSSNNITNSFDSIAEGAGPSVAAFLGEGGVIPPEALEAWLDDVVSIALASGFSMVFKAAEGHEDDASFQEDGVVLNHVTDVSLIGSATGSVTGTVHMTGEDSGTGSLLASIDDYNNFGLAAIGNIILAPPSRSVFELSMIRYDANTATTSFFISAALSVTGNIGAKVLIDRIVITEIETNAEDPAPSVQGNVVVVSGGERYECRAVYDAVKGISTSCSH